MELELLLEKALIPLFQNLAFLLSLVVIYSFGQRYVHTLNPVYQQLIFGIIFGIVAVIGMLSPIRVMQGFVIDPRAIIVLASGLFVGTTAAFITAAIAIIARLFIGGIGVIAGVGTIVIILAVVVVVRRRWNDQLHHRPNRFYLLMGVIVLAVHIPFAVLIPAHATNDIFSLALPLALFLVLGTFLVLALLAREKRQTEIAHNLLSSEAKTRSVYNVLPDMLVRFHRNGTYLEVKPAETFAPLVPPDQLIGLHIRDTLPTDIAAATQEYIQDVLTTGKTIHYEYQLDISGDTRDYEARMVASGPDEVLAVVRDVTDQKHAERALRESEEQIASIINAMPSAVYIYDLVEQRSAYISPEASRILGYSPAEFAALGDQLLAHLVHPDEVNLLPAHHARFDVAQDGQILESEGRRRHADGRWVDLLFREIVFKRNPDGTARQMLGTFHDITEDKSSAEMLAYQANLLENVSDAIIATDTEFIITSWNKAAEQIYGWSAEEAIGLRVSDLTRPEFANNEDQSISSAFNKHGYWSGEYIQHRKDGEKIHIASATTLLKDTSGNPIGAVAVNRDITKSKKLEQRERDWRIEHEKMDLLNQFTSAVAHDFRTPISTIITSLYLLRQERNPDKQVERIDMVETQVLRLNQFIDDILTMIRLDSGEAFNKEPFDARYIVERVLKRLKQTRKHDSMPTITINIADDVPFIWGDDMALERALYRVVENAVQFTPPDGRVDVMMVYKEEQVLITVRDTGIGITPKALPHIFDRLYRGDEARPAHMGGTGLGLPIAKAIIEGHGGEITVESTPGKSSTFRLCIPIKT